MKLTPEEIQKEWEYRFTERLNSLCPDTEPGPEDRRVARQEADAWREQWLKEDK